MPVVRVDMIEGRPLQYKKAILDGIHQALCDSLLIPDDDRFQRIIEIPREDFEYPPNRSEQVIMIEIKLFAGRTGDTKRKLYRHIIDNLARDPGIDGMDIMIILYEIPMINWGIRGGQAASDVEMGFKVVI